MIKAAALISGDGARLQSLIDSVFFEEIQNFELLAIASDPSAYALGRARNAGISCYIVEEALFPNGASYSLALLNKLRDLDIDLIILDDFKPSLGEGLSRYYYGRIIGVRPALVPAFDGLRDDAVCAAALARGVQISGATAYYADPSGGVGPIIMQRSLEILPGDTPETLRRRITEVLEWDLLTEVVKLHCAGKLALKDGIVTLGEAAI